MAAGLEVERLRTVVEPEWSPLRDSTFPTLRTRHLRAELSYSAASRLEQPALHFFIRAQAIAQILPGLECSRNWPERSAAQSGDDWSQSRVMVGINQETLAEMVGTTRSRVNFFMNKFRKLGFIKYDGGLQVHNSLLSVVLHE